jgi:hypothetical protein
VWDAYPPREAQAKCRCHFKVTNYLQSCYKGSFRNLLVMIFIVHPQILFIE